MTARPKNLDLSQLAKRILDEAIGEEPKTTAPPPPPRDPPPPPPPPNGSGNGGGNGGDPGIHPALLGLLRNLPPVGTKLPPKRRAALTEAFKSTVNFIWPEEDDE